jgi:cytoskeletal protein RodZ
MIKQIDEMDRLLAIYNSIDSINKQQLSSFKKQVENQNKTIDDMSSKLIKSKKKNRRKNFVLGVLSVALVSIFAFVR